MGVADAEDRPRRGLHRRAGGGTGLRASGPAGRPAAARASRAPGPTACRQCGRSFEQYGIGGGHRTYCKECGARADRAIAQAPVMRCNECGKEFAAPSRVHRYCSAACRDEFARRRNREYQRKSMADPKKHAIALARSRLRDAASSAGKGGGRMRGRSGAGRGTGRPARAADASDQIACRLCGRSFAPYGAARPAYCKRCRDGADREIARVLRVDCKACGRKFSTTNRLVRYCSDACRVDGRRRRVREYMRAYSADPEHLAARAAHGRARTAARRAGKRAARQEAQQQ